MLQNIWGYAQPSQHLHDNDRLRLLGVLMTLRNRALYEQLAEGITNRSVLDDPAPLIKHIFQRLTFNFNNNDVKVDFPPTTEDVNGSETMDAKDITRIRIHYDCEWL